MSVIQVQGLQSLQGSKNAVLPLMAAALLHNGTIVITNVPRIQDVFCMLGILESLGCYCRLEGHALVIDTRNLSSSQVPDIEGKQMRSSVMLLGSLLGRLHEVETCYPGGCSMGRWGRTSGPRGNGSGYRHDSCRGRISTFPFPV